MNKLECVALVMLFTSCSVMYKPTMTNVPMFSEKGEMQASVSLEDLQLAYSVSKSVGLILNGQHLNRGPLSLGDGKTSDYQVRNTCIDGAIGMYTAGQKSSFDFFVGFGKGYSSVSYYEDGYLSGGNSHFNKFYFQPDLVLRNKKRVKIAFSIRVTLADFYELPLTSNGPTSLPNNWATFVEPSFTLRKDIGVIGLVGQLQYSAASEHADFYYGHFIPFHDRMALRFAFLLHVDKIVSKGVHL
ncbi:MAG: hypothetical protein WD824_18035 [Cyclobacteriaceae bacterium]